MIAIQTNPMNQQSSRAHDLALAGRSMNSQPHENKNIGAVFINFDVQMKDLSMFDMKIRFYAQNYPWDQIPRSRILHPGQDMRKLFALRGTRRGDLEA